MLDMADVKPSILSAGVILLIVCTGIPLLKWAMAKFPIPGFADLVATV